MRPRLRVFERRACDPAALLALPRPPLLPLTPHHPAPTNTATTLPRCLNLGSYNYLGFADDWKDTCGGDVLEALEKWPVGLASARMDMGTTALHTELEALVAKFLGKEDCLVYNMGFATNATTIPALAGAGDLIISDALNHTSIVNGARSSAAKTRVFAHNCEKSLEKVLREAISMGQPRTRRPWNKIFVAVEGIYSMEGEICNLKAIVEVCKKYKAYLYLDEAHSIGAMGKTGRGITEYCGVDTKDVNIMMGTFTKSFGGMGGYIAADKSVIDYLRISCSGSMYHNAMSPVVCQQVITAFQIIMGDKCGKVGKEKLDDLRNNSNYFRRELEKMGLHTYVTLCWAPLPHAIGHHCRTPLIHRSPTAHRSPPTLSSGTATMTRRSSRCYSTTPPKSSRSRASATSAASRSSWWASRRPRSSSRAAASACQPATHGRTSRLPLRTSPKSPRCSSSATPSRASARPRG